MQTKNAASPERASPVTISPKEGFASTGTKKKRQTGTAKARQPPTLNQSGIQRGIQLSFPKLT